MQIRNKTIGIFLILIINTFVFAILFLNYFHSQQKIFKNEERVILELQKGELDYYFERAQSDLFLLYDIVEGFNLNDDLCANKSDIESVFIKFANQKKHYDQIRFIDNKGMEKIRVNHSYNASQIVPDTLLQDKSDRYYFKETTKIEKGQIYLSPFDLNVENGEIEIPYKIVIRISTPIYNSENQLVGVLVLNYHANSLFRSLAHLSNKITNEFFFVNQDGYFLFSPHKTQDWSYLFPNKPQYKLGDQYAGIWGHIKDEKNGQVIEKGSIATYESYTPFKNELTKSSKNILDKGETWTIVSIISSKTIFESNLISWLYLLFLYILVSILVVIIYMNFRRLRIQSELLKTSKKELEKTNDNLEQIVEKRTAALKQEVDSRIEVSKNLLKQKNILQGILIASPDIIYLKEDSLKYVTVNKAFEDWTEKSAYEIIGKTDQEILEPEIVEFFKHTEYQVLLYNETVRVEKEFKTNNGFYTFDIYIIPVKIESNSKPGILGIARNVTEIVHQNDEINKFKVAIETSASNFVITNNRAEIEYVNKGFINLTGYTFDELKGKNPNIINSKYHGRDFYKNLWQTLASGKEWRGEFRNISKQGEYFWESASIVPLLNSKGKISNYIKVSQDITQIKKTEDELKHSRDQLKLITDNLPILISYIGKDYHFKFVNNKFQDWFKVPTDEIEGTHIKELIGEEGYINARKVLDRVFKGDFIAYEKDVSYTKLFNRIVQINLIPDLDDNNEVKGCFGMFIDVTKNNQMVNELEKAKIDAEKANQSKSIFLANMSHEIRTPLNSIIGFSRLISNKSGEDRILKSYSDTIQSSGKTLLSLINDVLDLAKIEAGKIEIQYRELNLNKFIHEIDNNYKILLNENANINFKVVVDNEIPSHIIIDELRLKQIVNNLMSNALKFTEKGFVEIHIGSEKTEKQKPNLYFEVRDSGIGIPENEKVKIFKSFEQRTMQDTSKYGGSGLGLAISQQLANNMNGFIGLTSEANVGSNFKLTLKEIESSNKVSESSIRTESDKDIKIVFEIAKILLVDDVDYNNQLIIESFKNQPFIFEVASNGKEGVEKAKSFQPDLIVMDLRMPKMNGIEATQQIRKIKELKAVPIICITASVLRIDQLELTDIFDHVLFKPLDFVQLEHLFMLYLRYEKIRTKKEEPSIEDTIFDFTRQIEDKTSLNEVFESQIIPKWEEAHKSPFMEASQEFGQLIQSIGNEFKIEYLKNYGQTIMDYADSFNLTELKKELDNFRIILKLIKNQK